MSASIDFMVTRLGNELYAALHRDRSAMKSGDIPLHRYWQRECGFEETLQHYDELAIAWNHARKQSKLELSSNDDLEITRTQASHVCTTVEDLYSLGVLGESEFALLRELTSTINERLQLWEGAD